MTIDTEDLRQQLAAAVEPLVERPAAYHRIGAGIARHRRTQVVTRVSAGAAVAALGAAVAVLAVPGGGGGADHRVPGATLRPASPSATAAGPSRVTVPDVRGENVVAAVDALTTLGLRPSARIQTEPNAPRGQVVGEYPVPGARVRPGTTVTVLYVGGAPVVGDLDADGRPDRFRLREVGGGDAVLTGTLTSGGRVSGAPFQLAGTPLRPAVRPVDLNRDGIGELLVGVRDGAVLRYRVYAYAAHALRFVPVPATPDGTLVRGGGGDVAFGFGCRGSLLQVVVAHRAGDLIPGDQFAGERHRYRLLGSTLVDSRPVVHGDLVDSADVEVWAGDSCGVR